VPGAFPGRGGIGSEVSCPHRLSGRATVSLCLQGVCGFFAVPVWQERHPVVWLTKHCSVALYCCLHILGLGNSTPHCISSRTSVRGFLIRYCVSSIAAHKNSPLAILAIFKARRMSDSSSCTQPTCLAWLADMLKTYKILEAASNNEIRLLPQQYKLRKPLRRWLMAVLSSR